jgi:chorismate mutase
MHKTNLTELRKQIDLTDQELIQVLRKRVSLVELVGKAKQGNSAPPLDPSRWQQVLDTRTEWAVELGLDPKFVVDLFNRIHEYALQIEGEICQK